MTNPFFTAGFSATIQVNEPSELKEFYQSILDKSKPISSDIKDILVTSVLRPVRPPEQAGFKIKSAHVAPTGLPDTYELRVVAEVNDLRSLTREANSCWENFWGARDNDWESPGEALYEILVASNANPAPIDMGIELCDPCQFFSHPDSEHAQSTESDHFFDPYERLETLAILADLGNPDSSAKSLPADVLSALQPAIALAQSRLPDALRHATGRGIKDIVGSPDPRQQAIISQVEKSPGLPLARIALIRTHADGTVDSRPFYVSARELARLPIVQESADNVEDLQDNPDGASDTPAP